MNTLHFAPVRVIDMKSLSHSDNSKCSAHSKGSKNKKIALAVHIFTFSPVTDQRDVVQERPVRGFRTLFFAPQENILQQTAWDVLPAALPEEVKIAAVLGITNERPASESNHFFYEPLQLLKLERNGAKKHGSKEDADLGGKRLRSPYGQRELVEMTTVCVPKTGAIKLTGLTYELDNPVIFDDRKQLAIWRERERYREELFGSMLPGTSCRPHRGALISSKTMMRRLREGEKEFLGELHGGRDGHACNHSLMLETLVGDLLMNEMPELPTLNRSLQQFIEANTNSNKESLSRDNPIKSSSGVIARDWSPITNPDTVSHSSKQINLNKSFSEFGNSQQQKKSLVSRANYSKAAAAMYLENHKKDSVKSTKHGKAVYNLWQDSGNSNEEIKTFHQVLANAQKINLSCTNKLS